MLRIVTWAVLSLVAAGSTIAFAEDCRQLPQGPARAACASQNNPAFAAKLDRCKQQGAQAGLTEGRAGGLGPFVQACMQRR
jgi:hypothetical protein